jgi:hypothetical protein
MVDLHNLAEYGAKWSSCQSCDSVPMNAFKGDEHNLHDSFPLDPLGAGVICGHTLKDRFALF